MNAEVPSLRRTDTLLTSSAKNKLIIDQLHQTVSMYGNK